MSSADGRLEQLVARKGLDDVDHGLGVVALRRQAEVRDHRVELAPQQRDFRGRLVIGARGPQAEEAMLAGDLAGGVEGLHADVVEITAAMHGRRRVRLGEHQQFGRARLAAQVPGEHDGRRRLACLGETAQDAEAAVAVAHQRVARAAALQPVVAITEEHEMSVVHPREQRARFAGVGLRHRAAARDRVRWPPRGRVRASRGKSATARRTSSSAARTRRSSSRACAASRGRSISIICQDSSCDRACPCRPP